VQLFLIEICPEKSPGRPWADYPPLKISQSRRPPGCPFGRGAPPTRAPGKDVDVAATEGQQDVEEVSTSLRMVPQLEGATGSRLKACASCGRVMAARRFPPPWTFEDHNNACFIVCDTRNYLAQLNKPFEISAMPGAFFPHILTRRDGCRCSGPARSLRRAAKQ